MYLLIDVGNSRIKWALAADEYTSNTGIHYGSFSQLAQFLSDLEVASTVIMISAVKQIDNLLQLFQQLGFGEVILAKSQACQAGITNSYEHPERMGIDRWLAMIAAYQQLDSMPNVQGAIIVDAGSALTIDVLTVQGRHLGGYIVPGLVMAQSALFASTEQVKRYDEPTLSKRSNDGLLKLGNNTLQCVEYGVINQHVALVERVKKNYPEYEIMITGGDGKLLASFFPSALVDENLVLKGLWQVRN